MERMSQTTSVTAPVHAPDLPYTAVLPDSRAGRFGNRLGYLMAGLPVGIVALVVSVAGFSIGVSTLVIWIGLPFLAGTLATARSFARLERRQVARATGRPIAVPHYRPAAAPGPKGWLNALRDPQSWRDLIHMVVALPVRTLTFSLALTWTVGGLGELLYGLWSWSLPEGDNAGLLDLMYGIDSPAADIAFHTAIGVVLLATALPVVRGLTALQAALSRALLGRPEVF